MANERLVEAVVRAVCCDGECEYHADALCPVARNNHLWGARKAVDALAAAVREDDGAVEAIRAVLNTAYWQMEHGQMQQATATMLDAIADWMEGKAPGGNPAQGKPEIGQSGDDRAAIGSEKNVS